MQKTKGRVDEALLEALFQFKPAPSTPDALVCLRDQRVQDAAVSVAEEMRRVAMLRDEEVKEHNRKSKRKHSLINWRGFYVGGVGIGIVRAKRSWRKYDWFTFPAYNTKPHQNAKKFCAEMRIMRGALESGCICIGGLVVIGERQHDGRSGVMREWGLDPCEACRDCMRDPRKRPMLRARTLIVTAQPLSQFRNIEPIPELMAAHGEKW